MRRSAETPLRPARRGDGDEGNLSPRRGHSERRTSRAGSGQLARLIFGHYRELVTADDAKTWFAIAPVKTTGKAATKRTPFVGLPSRVTTPAQQLN